MKQPQGWMSLKSYKRGFRDAKKGKNRASCPYQLCDACRKMAVKKIRWEMGWEEARYRISSRNSKIDKKELEKIAAICPEPRMKHEKLVAKKKHKKKKHHRE